MRTDKHKLCTVAYTDTVATCATAHVLVWRCRESLVGVIPYSLLSHTPREKQTPCGGPCPRPPAEPPAADQRAPPSQQPSTALVAAARASLDVSELQDDRGSKRDALARTPPPATAPESALPPPLTHARGLRPAGVRASRLHSPAQPPLLSRRCSLSPPTTMPPPPSPPPPTPTPTPPGRPPPRALPPPTPSAARRSVLAPPAAPTGDPPAQVHALRCLPQTQCLPSHTPTPSSPRPTPSHPLYTPHHNHGAAFHRAYPTGRRHPTRSSPTRLPPFPLPHPKPPPPDAQPHRAASPHALPRDTRRSIHSDRPCPPSPAQSREPHRNPPRYKGQHPSPDAWTSPPSTLARSIIVGVGTLVASLPSFVGALRAPLR